MLQCAKEKNNNKKKKNTQTYFPHKNDKVPVWLNYFPADMLTRIMFVVVQVLVVVFSCHVIVEPILVHL